MTVNYPLALAHANTKYVILADKKNDITCHCLHLKILKCSHDMLYRLFLIRKKNVCAVTNNSIKWVADKKIIAI